MSSIPENTSNATFTLTPAQARYWLAQYGERLPADQAERYRRIAEGEPATWTPPTTDRLDSFLSHLHRGGAWAYYWTDQGKLSRWFETDGRRPKLLNKARNMYFGVHPTRGIPTRNSRGEEKPPGYVRSQIEYIAAINALFAEFDAKDHGGSKQAALEHVMAQDPPPTCIIDSGGGYHGYWFLVGPFRILTDEDRERAKRAQYAWVDYTGSDEDAKDLARVLRLPGTRNCKPEYGPDFPVVDFVLYQPERTYTFDELEALARQHPAETPDIVSGVNKPVNLDAHQRAAMRGDRLLARVEQALGRLAAWRADGYGSWINTGMALKELGPQGFMLWDRWSAGSPKYHDAGNADMMAGKWETFRSGNASAPGSDLISLRSLWQWEKEDSPGLRGQCEQAARLLEAEPGERPAAEELPERVRKCGTVVDVVRPLRLESPLHRRHLWCKVTTLCRYCASVEARKLIEQLQRAAQDGELHVTRVEGKKDRSLARKLGKGHYRRRPMNDGTVVIFNDKGVGTPLHESHFADFARWVNLVLAGDTAHRATGLLGESPEEAEHREAENERKRSKGKPGEAEKLIVSGIHTDAPEDRAQACYRRAFESVKQRILARPIKSAYDAERAISLVTDAYKRELSAEGFKAEALKITLKCRIARMEEWRVTYALNDIQTGSGDEHTRSPGGPSPGV